MDRQYQSLFSFDKKHKGHVHTLGQRFRQNPVFTANNTPSTQRMYILFVYFRLL